MTDAGFDLRALWLALDERRRASGKTWAAVAREMNRVAASTIAGLADKESAEGDGVLQMLFWLGRTPESFVPDAPDATAEPFRLHPVAADRVRGMTWKAVGQEIGGCTPAMLTRLATGGRVGFPGVMRMVRWLGQPAARFTWAAPRGLPIPPALPS